MPHYTSHAGWTDITTTITDGMTPWPEQGAVEVRRIKSISDGATANVTRLHMSAHTGTHLDAPLHFFNNKEDMSETNIDALIGPAKVFEIKHEREITFAEIQQFDINEGDRILFRTRNSDTDWEHEPFKEDYVYLGKDAAEYLVQKKVRTVGIDYLSIGGGDTGGDVHCILFEARIHIIEGLKLGGIETGEYDMICLPLKIKDADGAPARVVIKKRKEAAA